MTSQDNHPTRGTQTSKSALMAPYQRSSDFIISAEAYEQLAENDPARARYQIILRLYDTCYPRVYSFLRRSVSADVADDLAQETFLRLLSLKKIERMSISISYLFRIAQNLIRRRYNTLARKRAVLEDEFRHEQHRITVHQASESSTLTVDSERLDLAIRHLSIREHEVLRLIVCEGMSYASAARVLGVPVSTVNNWKYRALARLREIIEVGVEADVQQHTTKDRSGNDFRRDSTRGSGQQGQGTRPFEGSDQSTPLGARGSSQPVLAARVAG